MEESKVNDLIQELFTKAFEAHIEKYGTLRGVLQGDMKELIERRKEGWDL